MITATTHHPDRVARNTTFLTIAQALQKVLSFAYFAYIAGQIGDTNIGKYVWTLSFTGIFALFMEFGLSRVLTREVSKAYDKAKIYLANVLGLKLILAFITVILAVITIQAMGREPIVVLMVYIATAIIILDTFTQTFYSVFRAFQILKYEALGIVIYQAIIVVSGYIVIQMGLGLRALVVAVLLGSSFNLVYSFCLIIIKGKIRPRFSFNKKIGKFLLGIAIPFALYGIFYKVSISVDSVMLGVLAGDKYVGWYSVASKIAVALTFLPGAFATSLFPAFSHYFVSSRENLKKTFQNAMFYLMAVSLPLTVGIFVLAEDIVLKVWGPVFGASSVALKIMISGLVFIFLNFPVGNLLNACNRQVVNTINMGITMAFNIVLNFILIPRYDYIGASYSALISAFLLLALGLPWVSKIIDYNKKYIIKKFLITLVSALLMGGFVYLVKPYINILLVIPAAMVVYVIFLFILRGLKRQDITGLVRSVLRRNEDLAKEIQN
ncbi:MAG: flippase [Patescibacteria group bacterium]